MQNDPMQQEDAIVSSENNCAHCGQLLAVNPYRTQLCTTCRQQYIRFPIPVWIKAFGAGILLIVLYGLISFPKHLETGIHYKRAKVAAEDHRYVMAQKEFAYVVEKEPAYLDAQCYLLITAVHNYDLATVSDVYKRLSDKKIENNTLFNEVQGAIDQVNNYYPTAALDSFLQKQSMPLDSMKDAELVAYLAGNPRDFIIRLRLASRFFDHKDYVAADSLLNDVLNDEPGYGPAVLMKPSLKREMLQFDSSFYYADMLIAANKDDMFGQSSKVRTLLKQKKDKEAMELAQTCYTQDPHNGYTLASLAMVYHFTGDSKKRDAIMLEASKDSLVKDQLAYVKDIISGKESFRN